MAYFDQIVYMYGQHFLTNGMRNNIFFLLDEALLNIRQAGRGQLVKILITLEPHGIFWSNFAHV